MNGQRITGSITGRVVVLQGSVVAGASITVVNLATGATQALESSAEGTFEALGLAPTVYKITISAPGFSPYSTTVPIRVGVAAC
jgi:hypothetical protein